MRLRMLFTIGILLLATGCVPGSQPSHSLPPESSPGSAPGDLPAGSGSTGQGAGTQPDQPGASGTGNSAGQGTGNSAGQGTGTGTQAGGGKPSVGGGQTGTGQTAGGQTAGGPSAGGKPSAGGGQKTETPPAAPAVPRLAILVYHDVADQASGGYTISQTQLEEQIQMLKDEGYAFYRLADVERLLSGAESMPAKGVMLAFDDGYQSFATRVLPVAQKYSVPAVCFMVTKYSDFDIFMGIPHMAPVEMQRVVASGLLELAGHSYDGHRTAETADGTHGPVLINRIRKPQSSLIETDAEYAERVRTDFANTAKVLTGLKAGTGARHFTFPYGLRSDEAVRLGREAGFQYFYIGTDQLVTPDTDPGAIPRVHAGAPEITAEVLRDRLRDLFGKQ
ncbi:MAG TPA: polysaccharide deacetylase family protein [Symbiobacteriaceae bacterium]|nr:polysaccharide deacetylase family protein [Symbiobacteriaceae bacterium]